MLGGIDLGGTQVRVAVARSDCRIEAGLRTQTHNFKRPEEFVEWCARAFDRLTHGRRLDGVGIGAPGPCDPTRGMLLNPPNLGFWKENLPLGPMLAARIEAPVYLENDANLAALGEHRRGAGRGVRNLVYITWSTGIGSGIIIEGRLYSGSHGTAGELGHTIVVPDGPLCGCGQHGCLEAVAAGSGIERTTGRPAVEVFQAAAQGDRQARAQVAGAARTMGVALVNLANLLDPDVIVIGGGLTKSWRLVLPDLVAPLKESPFVKPYRRPKVVRARLGQRVGLVGAVEWARENL
ncbi:MAG: ROK family protein [Chloroflexi bacterium]|nr:MAG: ROK family protein [Chloroflexota bacterium]TME16436.1 MAG: ROK family protein [Chloroflexota bacterium]TME17576.1 MAG: ROK family protein [Chloroflexota bacterium]